MMRRFCAYIEKVFDFSRHVSGLVDARQRPRITTAAIWLSGFLMAVMRAGSLNAIAGVLRVPHHFESLIGSRKPSADTIARVFARMAAAALRGLLCVVNHQLKRNKLLTLRWPLRFAALDGHEFFSLTKALLPAVLPAPLRVLHTQESITKRQCRNGSRQVRKECHQWYWATTISQSRLPAEALWEAAHARWEIENDLFHNMSTYWSLDHCYTHEPTAIVNFILTLFLAFLLVQTFYHRNLKPLLRARFTVIGLTDELRIGLGTLGPGCVWVITPSLPGP